MVLCVGADHTEELVLNQDCFVISTVFKEECNDLPLPTCETRGCLDSL